MPQPLPNIASSEWAWEPFRRDAFQLIIWGYQAMEEEIRSSRDEEYITEYICEGIEKNQREVFPLDDQLWQHYGKYVLRNEHPSSIHGRHGKKRLRIDIAIVDSRRRPHIEYTFEAKRCHDKLSSSHKVNEPIDWYAQGVTAFLEGKYASDVAEAGLLGLIQSDDEVHWKALLAANDERQL